MKLEQRQSKRAEDDDTPNKSLDVRAKQRLSYRVVFVTRSCVNAVSPQVNSVVLLSVILPIVIVEITKIFIRRKSGD